MSRTAFGSRRSRRFVLKTSSGIAGALALIVAASYSGGVARADGGPVPVRSNVQIFDARGDAGASDYCIDAPAILVGQQICGGVVRSSVTATSDPRGFALGGIAPVPKASSVPLLVPNNFQGIPVPQQVQDGLRQIKFNNIPSQCQASYPALNEGDNDQTCGGPSYGDSALGFISSSANSHVYSTGDSQDPTSTRTVADSRLDYGDLPGLQSAYDNVRALATSGLNANGDPVGLSTLDAGKISILSGLFTVEGINSTTDVAFNGTKEGMAASTSFKYVSAAIAGIPVDITKDGAVLATNKVPPDQVKTLTEQLDTALKENNGFGVKLLPAPPIEATSSFVKASSGGILVTYRGSTGTDVTYTQLLGATASQVSAVAKSDSTGSAANDSASGAAANSGTVSPSSLSGSGSLSTSSSAIGTGAGPDLATVDASDSGTEMGALADGAPGRAAAALGNGGDGQAAVGDDPSTVSLGSARQLGDQALLAGFNASQPLAASQLRRIYPLFALLLLGSLAAMALRRRPSKGSV